MKVRTKLIVGFLIIVALTWVMGFFAWSSSRNLHKQFAAVEDIILPGVMAMDDIETTAIEAHHQTTNYILFGDAGAREAALANLNHLEEIKTEDHISGTTGVEQSETGVTMVTLITAVCMSIESLIDQKDLGVDQYDLLTKDRYTDIPALLALQEEVRRRQDIYIEQLAAIKATSDKTYESSLYALIGITGAISLLAAAAAILTTRAIVRPLHALHKGTEVVAQGKLDHKVGTNARDEIGQLSRAFDRMTASLSTSTTSISKLNDEIKERKQAEKELQAANQKLLELDKMKDSFLSTVSHELRTPLTSIKSFAEILLTYDEDKATQKEFLTIINEESDRLTNLINDFLDLSKIESGRMQWETVELSLIPVVQNAINITQAIAKQKNLTVEYISAPDLPPVSGDKDRLVQVVTNLLSNAIKFTPEGGRINVEVKVTGAGKPKGASRMVVVSVSDTGIGIDPENYEAVFEKFKQVGDTLTDKPKGTGLGLPICKEIIEHYGGKIWVESELDKGSTFSFSLPVTQEAEEPAEPAAKKPVKPAAEKPAEPAADEEPADTIEVIKKAKTVLVVDDEKNIRRYLTHELTRKGYNVLEASNGKEALELTRAHHPDLITLDIQMPDISGFDVTAVLKNDADTKDIPILILSVIEDTEKAYRLGANDYLTKPINKRQLLSKINHLLTGAKETILIVDDDKSLVKSVKYQLERRGYPTYVAYDGKQALEMVKSHHADLILLDIVMPNMDGYEVIKALKSDPETADIRIVLMTGIEIDGGRVKALSIGATEYVKKSSGFSKLYETIENILGSKVTA